MQPNRYFTAKLALKSLPEKPGVYLMYSSENQIVYIGKSSSLKQRLSHYFSSRAFKDIKTQEMVFQTHSFEIIQTRSAKEALVLEHNLIKKHLPKYNVLLKDGKTYPYLKIDGMHPFPKVTMIRSRETHHGERFGPYPNVDSARKTLEFIQKFFKIRNCEDVYFKNRSRPCLQYEIKRCSAPCMGLISQESYRAQIQQVRGLLSGHVESVVPKLVQRMDQAAQEEDFEKAALVRDIIQHIQTTLNQQAVEYKSINLDILYFHDETLTPGLQILQIRNGQLIHAEAYDLQSSLGSSDELRLNMIGQYLQREYQYDDPIELLLYPMIDVAGYLNEIFRKLKFLSVRSKMAKHWVDLARINAQGFVNRIDANAVIMAEGIVDSSWSAPIESCVCFDISHHQGSDARASMVAVVNGKPLKKYYRQYLLNGVTPGDDCASLQHAVKKALKSMSEQKILIPDLWVIDGGKSQLAAVAKLIDVFISMPRIISIGKGRTRRLQNERYYIWNNNKAEEVRPSGVFKRLICFARDESHRFALSAHRKTKRKNLTVSELETIPGVGNKKAAKLLNHFGGIRVLKEALIEELKKVSGVNQELAQRIYSHFHPGEY